MLEVITVRFKRGGKQYYYSTDGSVVNPGDGVIVETARGLEFGECVRGNYELPTEKVTTQIKALVRVATETDYATIEKNQEKEIWAREICLQKIAYHKLSMKIIGVEYSFDCNKVLFYFTSEGRVDFRSLVKDLASTIHARIELRQIGVRDEAKMLGGLGICGRPYCCKQFLDKFAPVSIKMAKTQNLSLNPTKISGSCGRLMCCLKYEQDAYEYLLKKAPRAESFVETPDGAGTISAVNLLRQQVTVRLESDPSVAKKYHNSEIVVVRSGRGRRPEGYVEPPKKELEKQRKIQEHPVQSSSSENKLANNLESILNPTVQQGKKPIQRPKNQRSRKPRNGQSKVSGKEEAEGQGAVQKPKPKRPQGNKNPIEKQKNPQKPVNQKQKNPQKPMNQKPKSPLQQEQGGQNPKPPSVKKFKPKDKDKEVE